MTTTRTTTRRTRRTRGGLTVPADVERGGDGDPVPTDVAYRLTARAASQRALAGAVLGSARSLAPIVLAVVLLHRLGWAAPSVFWMVAAALSALVVVRAAVGYGRTRRRLASLVVTVTGETIAVAFRPPSVGAGTPYPAADDYAIERRRVARIVEIDGPLGGIVVQSEPDARSGAVLSARVPRGGDGYAAVRRALEGWRPFHRRGRRGPAARVAVFGLVVAGIFFVPFFLDDFVARSRLLGAVVVAALLLVVRGAVRG